MIDRVNSMISCILVLMMFSACAHISVDPHSEGSLMQRVEKEWVAKVNRDWGTVYDMGVAEFKNKYDKKDFVRMANVIIDEFQIKDIKIIEPGRKATAVVDYKTSHMQYEFNMSASEEWWWEDGEWRLNLLPAMELPFTDKK